MMSKKIVYLLFPMVVLGLTAVLAPAATPDHLNLENPIALNSQSRAVDGCPAAADMLRDPFILAKGPGGGGSDNGSGVSGGSGISGGGNSGGSGGSSGSGVSAGGNNDGDCCDNGPRGGLGPAKGEAHQYQYQNQNKYVYSNSFQNKEKMKNHYGPGDCDGNDGDGPRDGTGYGAGAIR